MKVTGSKLVATLTLASGGTATITYDVVVKSTDTSTVTNTAVIKNGVVWHDLRRSLRLSGTICLTRSGTLLAP